LLSFIRSFAAACLALARPLSGYKWPAKDVIFDFTKDADYRDNKLKLKFEIDRP
jgi:hypothetical protein